uniref:Sushi domain-containing protein n=1 Tax=Accipiter nisus TaxID=211598 RepID=A0A8B9RWM0_9AVES
MTVVPHPWLLPVSLPEALPPEGGPHPRGSSPAADDCGPPPRMTHSRPSSDERASSFPVGSRVTYTCTEGSIKIPGRSDTVECLPGARWSTLPEPCGRSCAAPTRLRFAALSTVDERINFFPVGTNVSYVCRPGYENTSESSPTSTCLENLTWSEAAELCRSEYPCPAPLAESRSGTCSQTLRNLFFSCVFSLRYKLDGRHFIQCQLKGNDVEWSKLPTCKLITCFSPPQISNGKHDGEGVEKFAYNSTVTYSCDSGFQLVGNVSIRCTSTDKTNGVWSGAAPECKGGFHVGNEDTRSVLEGHLEFEGTHRWDSLVTASLVAGVFIFSHIFFQCQGAVLPRHSDSLYLCTKPKTTIPLGQTKEPSVFQSTWASLASSHKPAALKT